MDTWDKKRGGNTFVVFIIRPVEFCLMISHALVHLQLCTRFLASDSSGAASRRGASEHGAGLKQF